MYSISCALTVFQNVASQTLEGLRKETRVGLEYALQSHKTIDLQVDMNAPVIIIPEEYAFSSTLFLCDLTFHQHYLL